MASNDERHILVLTTAGSDEQAEQLARDLVDRRLAACVNMVGGVCSVYRWEGRIEREQERLLIIKTAARLFDRVREAIRELHSYDVPEILSVPIDDGDPDYLAWLGGQLDS